MVDMVDCFGFMFDLLIMFLLVSVTQNYLLIYLISS